MSSACDRRTVMMSPTLTLSLRQGTPNLYWLSPTFSTLFVLKSQHHGSLILPSAVQTVAFRELTPRKQVSLGKKSCPWEMGGINCQVLISIISHPRPPVLMDERDCKRITVMVHVNPSSETDVITAWPKGQASGVCLMEQGPKTSTLDAFPRYRPA